jgi:hypothetical protein
MKEIKELERQAHTPNNQKKTWKTCKALELKKRRRIVGHFIEVEFEENCLHGKLDDEDEKFKNCIYNYCRASSPHQCKILHAHKLLFYNIIT